MPSFTIPEEDQVLYERSSEIIKDRLAHPAPPMVDTKPQKAELYRALSALRRSFFTELSAAAKNTGTEISHHAREGRDFRDKLDTTIMKFKALLGKRYLEVLKQATEGIGELFTEESSETSIPAPAIIHLEVALRNALNTTEALVKARILQSTETSITQGLPPKGEDGLEVARNSGSLIQQIAKLHMLEFIMTRSMWAYPKMTMMGTELTEPHNNQFVIGKNQKGKACLGFHPELLANAEMTALILSRMDSQRMGCPFATLAGSLLEGTVRAITPLLEEAKPDELTIYYIRSQATSELISNVLS